MTDTVNRKARRVARVPVTTMEELPILSEEERGEMLASLKAAEADIAAGRRVEHDAGTFVDRLMGARAAALNNRES